MSDKTNKATYLNKVYLTSDAFATCLQHALTTEKDEVMGMLLGRIDEDKCVAHVSISVILNRMDKQPDRVEISPEQLLSASAFAEELTKTSGNRVTVVGWYHSHPHITVWPSHVDLNTQQMYQMMDSLFVGLIFSVYQNGTGATGNHVQLTCFQAIKKDTEFSRREIELEIENSELNESNLNAIVGLPQVLAQEEIQRHDKASGKSRNDIVTTIYNNALQTIIISDIVSKVAKPLYEDLEARLQSAKLRVIELEDIKKSLNKNVESG